MSVDAKQAPLATEPPALVQLRGISVEFPGVKALQEVDFRLFAGEVHALMGRTARASRRSSRR